MSSLTRLKDFVRKVARMRRTAETAEAAIEDVDTLHDTSVTLTHLSQDASEASDSATEILDAASKIPLPPTEELVPVSRGVSALNTTLKKTVVPALSTVASLLGTVTVLLAPILILLRDSKAKRDGLVTSFERAASVHEQVVAAYPKGAPTEMRSETGALEEALATVEDKLKALDDALDRVDAALKSLAPVHDLATILDPVEHAMEPVSDAIHGFLARNGKLLKNLKRAADAFSDKGTWAVSRIKAALKSAGIDVGFIDRINAKVQKLIGSAQDRMLSPIKTLEREASARLKALETPVSTLEAEVSGVLTQIAQVSDKVQAELDAYVVAAAKIGIHPK